MRRALAAAALTLAARVQATPPPDAPGVLKFDLFGGGRLVVYTPKDPTPGPASLRADADELRRRGFRAVVTAPDPAVCRVFKRRGFRTVIVAVADPTDTHALRAAAKQRRCADGYAVGRSGLARGRYARRELVSAVERLRRTTGRPVTVQEAIESYAHDPGLLQLGDWVYPSANPFLVDAETRQPQSACGWAAAHYYTLRERVPAGTPVVLADTGLPTAGGTAANEHYQRAYFGCIESRGVRFAYFEAFDQPGRSDLPAGAHWGLFRSDGTPKLWAASQAAPALTLARRGAWVRGVVRNAAPERVRVAVYGRDGRWTLRGTSAVRRHGQWKVHAPGAAAGVLVAAAHRPPEAVERLPAVDGEQVLALAQSPE